MIKIYRALITDFSQADYTKQYGLLDCTLKKKIDVKKKPEDKMRSLAGYILLWRGAFELYQKSDFSICLNEHGKPFCDFCYFSISHSETNVVCVFSDNPVGIDIQKIKPIKKRESYRLFNSAESEYVNAKNDLISKRYIEIFTKKESAVKLMGIPLSSGKIIDTFSKDFCFETQYKDEFIITVCSKNIDIL